MKAGEKVRTRRQNAGWTLDELAKRIGVKSRAYVSNIENGYTPLGPKVRQKLASAFGCASDEFVDDAPESVVRENPAGMLRYARTSQSIHVPVVGEVGAAEFAFSFDAPPEEYLPVLVESPTSKKYAALRVVGACMEPTVRDGEFVIVAEADTVPDGKLGVFRLDGGYTLKRPFRKADHVELRPDNRKFKSLRIATNKLVAVGVVVGFFRKP